MQNYKRREAANATRSFANLVCKGGNASLVLPPRLAPTVIHFNVARLSESLSASIETLSVDELQPGSDVANRGGRPITDYKHAACFFDWLGAASPRTVKRCLAHGSQHVQWIMWMAHPNQADRPQGSHREESAASSPNAPVSVELGGGVHWITACPVDHVDGSPKPRRSSARIPPRKW